MPYIKEIERHTLGYSGQPQNSGQLNYMITMLCVEYYESNSPGYASINDILGALEGAKLEFYRRVAAPYENRKIIENGDVYGIVG